MYNAQHRKYPLFFVFVFCALLHLADTKTAEQTFPVTYERDMILALWGRYTQATANFNQLHCSISSDCTRSAAVEANFDIRTRTGLLFCFYRLICPAQSKIQIASFIQKPAKGVEL